MLFGVHTKAISCPHIEVYCTLKDTLDLITTTAYKLYHSRTVKEGHFELKQGKAL